MASLSSGAALPGGALHHNLPLEIDGAAMVLRRTGSAVLDSLPRPTEFQVQLAAWRAGVPTPEPIVCGPNWMVARRHPGSAIPADAFEGDVEGLAVELATTLAQIHRVEAPIAGLDPAPADPPEATVTKLYAWLDRRGEAHPALEWGLAQLAATAPAAIPAVLCHGDFRVGNVLVHHQRLEAVLDWEFSGWNDPVADLGWLCVRHWRRGRDDLAATGLVTADAFCRFYTDAGGILVEPARLLWWQLAGTLRWALIALAQADRFAAGEDTSIDRALTGRRLPQIEVEILTLADQLAPGRRLPVPPSPPGLTCPGDLPDAAALRTIRGADAEIAWRIADTDDAQQRREGAGWITLAHQIRAGDRSTATQSILVADARHRAEIAFAAGLRP
jgi:aminoglycoside phosphotransferase (APT) family kinase protein